MINTTNILLFLIVLFLSYLVIQRIFNYFKDFKNRYFNSGVKMGADKTLEAILGKAKQGKKLK